jgi:hypothetical protein
MAIERAGESSEAGMAAQAGDKNGMERVEQRPWQTWPSKWFRGLLVRSFTAAVEPSIGVLAGSGNRVSGKVRWNRAKSRSIPAAQSASMGTSANESLDN